MNQIPGFELLFKLHAKEFKSKSDVLVCLLHAALWKHGLLVTSLKDNVESTSESLPDDWNSKAYYKLCYAGVINGAESRFELRAIVESDNLVTNLVRNRPEPIDFRSVTISLKDLPEDFTNYASVSQKLPACYEAFSKDLFVLFNVTKPEASGASLLLERPRGPAEWRSERNASRPTVPYGHSDLYPAGPSPFPLSPLSIRDPFAPPTGGMIFDPLLHPRRPFRPRFDPVGPFGRLPFGYNPDPDAGGAPPGFDDMFS